MNNEGYPETFLISIDHQDEFRISETGVTYVRSDIFNPKWDQIKTAHEVVREHLLELKKSQIENIKLKEEITDLKFKLLSKED